MTRCAILAVVFISVGAAAAPAQSLEEQVVVLVNEQRWVNGQLPPLKHESLLDVSSETHSINMGARDFFAHCDLDTGTLPWDRMTSAGYIWNSAAENIAAGYATAAAVMNGWMNSAGHRANILSASVSEIGVGYADQSGDAGTVRVDQDGDCSPNVTAGPYVHYWTQNFGRRNSVYPVVIEREAYATSTLDVGLYVYGAGWAVEMRFRNEDGPWSQWEPYTPGRDWTLSPGDGLKTVTCELRNGGTVRTSEDRILAEGTPVLAAGDGGFTVGALTVFPASPNPFRASTTLGFALDAPGSVTVRVFDILGRELALLKRGDLPAGEHAVVWSGRDRAGRAQPPGIYFFRFEAGDAVRTTKAILAGG